MFKCSNCNKTIWFFHKYYTCSYCDDKECENCYNSNSSLSKCKDCEGMFCKKHINQKNHDCVEEEKENMVEEKVECKNCGNKISEDDVTNCYNCDKQFCANCIRECEECNENFCETCYSNSSHECDVGFEMIIGFKNCNDKFIFNFSNKQTAKDTYAKILMLNLPML